MSGVEKMTLRRRLSATYIVNIFRIYYILSFTFMLKYKTVGTYVYFRMPVPNRSGP